MRNIKDILKGIGCFVSSIFCVGVAYGSCSNTKEESTKDNVDRELERLWDAYNSTCCWEDERREQLLEQIKELEKEKL